MGAFDDREMLEVAKEECGRLEADVLLLLDKLTQARAEAQNAQNLLALAVVQMGGVLKITDQALLMGSTVELHAVREMALSLTRFWTITPDAPTVRDHPDKPARDLEDAYKTIRALVGEPQPTPDSQKKQKGEEAAPPAGDAQSTPAGEGERLCDVCRRPCVWLSLGHWAHLPAGKWQEPRHEAKVTVWR